MILELNENEMNQVSVCVCIYIYMENDYFVQFILYFVSHFQYAMCNSLFDPFW